MTSSGLVKLGDFGISRVLSNTLSRARTKIGTEAFCSPEFIEDEAYGFKSDIWSLEVTLYYIAALKLPFEGGNPMHLMRSIDEGKYSPVPSHVIEDIQNLIQMMLQTEPDKRPTVDQLLK